MEAQLIQLQVLLSHQEEDILRLSGEVSAQQREIADLRKQITQILSKLEGDDSGVMRLPEEETPPPHY